MKKILPLFIPVFFYWPMKVVEWVYAKPTIPEVVMISMPPATYDCSSCPQVVGIMVDACNDGSGEEGNEFVIVHAGFGFNVDDISLDIANGTMFPPEVDPGAGLGCGWQIPLAGLMSSLQSFPGCSAANVIAAGPGTDIPAGAVVLIFSDGQVPTSLYDISSLCAQGVSIYVMQNACNRTGGAFANGTASGCPSYRSAAITVAGCSIDSLTYDRCTIAIANIATETTFVYEDAAGTQDTLILSCDDVPFDVYSFPPPPTITGVVTNTSCPGDADGAIEIIAPGAICFDWAHLGASCDAQNISGLSSGMYYLTVTDAGGCQAMDSFIISDPTAITIDFVASGLACNGGPTGAIGIDVNGGTPFDTIIIPDIPPDTIYTYLYDWDWLDNPGNEFFDANSDLVEDRDLDSLNAGDYSILVTDANGCTAMVTATVDSFATPMKIVAPDTIFLPCAGSTTNINILVTGGFPALPDFYNYDWDGDGDFLELEDTSGVGAGTYMVAVEEPISGCLSFDTIVVIAPPLLSISVAETDAACNSAPTGSYIITITGGTSPYDYSGGPNPVMNHPGPTITINNVPGGSYTVTVTDNNGCTATSAVSINVPPAIVIDAFASGLACNGGPTGSIGLDVTGGTPLDTIIIPDIPPDTVYTYQYDWDWLSTGPNDDFDENGDMMDEEDLDSLFNGQYTVTVTDLNGCTAVTTVTVDLYLSPIIIMAPSTIMLVCGGVNTNIDITVSGGNPSPPGAYLYDWDQDSMFDDPQDLTNVGIGTYIVAVTEPISGCLSYDTIVVTAPDTLEAIAVGDTAVCGGTPSGSITITIIGGTGPFDYTLNTIPFDPMNTLMGINLASPIVIPNLDAGMYSMFITDANGCTDFAVAIVDEADTLSAQAFSGVITCDGGTTNVWVEAVGGTGPFCYDWSTAAGASCMSMTPVSEPDTLYNVPAGTYSVTVVDANDCMTVTQVTVTDPLPITYTFSASICANEMYTLPGGAMTNIPNTYTTTFVGGAANGCDSIVMVTLTVNPLITKPPVMASFCAGDSVQVYGIWYDTPVMFTDTINSVTAACDTSVMITITQNPLIPKPIAANFCAGDSVQVYGIWYDMAGTFTDTVSSVTAACDTILNITITQNPLIPKPIAANFCAGDSVQVYGIWYDMAGTFTDTVSSVTAACDTILNITIMQNPLIPKPIAANFCAGDSVQVYGIWYDMAGTFTDTVSSVTAACDTILNITIMQNPLIPKPIAANFCAGDSVQVYGIWYDMAGTFTDTVSSVTAACDTILNITITQNPLIPKPIAANFCAGDSVQVYGIWYDMAGTFTDTVSSVTAACDTILNITITQNPLIPKPIAANFCAGDSVQVYGIWYDMAGTFTDTVSSVTAACDTILNITITQNPLIPKPIFANFCVGDSVQVYGIWYDVAGTFTDTVSSVTAACDTILNITITQNPLIPKSVNASFCAGDSVQVYGIWYDAAGTFTDTVNSVTAACDTIVTITVMQTPLIPKPVSDSYCIGDSVLVYGEWYDTPGTFTDTVASITGSCDTLLTITITEDPLFTRTINRSHCPGDSVQVYGIWYTAPSNTVVTAASTTGGCDTVVTINVTLNPYLTKPVNASFCAGDSVQVYGIWYDAAGTFTDTVNSVTAACDTIVTITVMQTPLIPKAVSDSYCIGDSVLAYGEWYDTPGTFTDTVASITGSCDTLLTINITEDPLFTRTINRNHCPGDSVQVYGIWYTAPSNTVVTAISTTGGCDTLVTINVTLNPYLTKPVNASFCAGDSVRVYGVWYDAAGTFTDTVNSVTAACDTIVTITVIQTPLIPKNVNAVFCAGDSVQVYGVWYSAANTYTDTIVSVTVACDTIVTINVTEQSLIPKTVNANHCPGDSVQVYGVWYSGPLTTTDTVASITGSCDTLVTINISLLSTSAGSETNIGCTGDGYSVTVNGTLYNEANPTGTETLTNAAGCDSVVTIALVFNSTSTGTETYTGCVGDGYFVVVDGTTYNESNPSGTETLTNAEGCDSVVTVNLTFNSTSIGTETYTGCVGDGYSVTVNGTLYNEGNPSGTETLNNSNGCDSVVTVTLTFNNESTGTETYTGCIGDGYFVVVNGTTYNESNPSGTETLNNSNGCDSVVTITLTFGNSVSGTETYTGCTGDGYSVNVNGTLYNEANPTGSETLTSAAGCDSIVTITLTYNLETTGNETYTGCTGDGYFVVVDGTTYNESNPSGTETLTNADGCDSTVTITLTFNNTSTSTETYTGCVGDGYSVVVGTTTYDESNPAGTEVLTNADGCDSTVTVNLTFNNTSSGTETYTGCIGDGYSVVVGTTTYNEGNPTGSETLTNAAGCDSVVTVTLSFGISVTGTETYTGCEGDGYSVVVGSTTFDESNPTGMETLTSGSGCDSIVTVTLTFNPETTGNETYIGCVGDGYSVVVGTTTYNESNPAGIEVLTNADGCDSTVTITLTFNNTSTGSETYTGCVGDGYSVVVGTTTYDESNPSGTEVLTNADGCDSTVTVNLTFNNTSAGTETYTGCVGDGYSVVVGITTYNEGNPTGTETLTNADGCDSVVTITLTFNSATAGSETYTGCDGDGYFVVVGGTTYNEANPNGTETLTNADGCDSVVTVNLTFNSPSTGNETYTGCVGDGYSVIVGITTYNQGNPSGTETLTNANGCDSVVTVSLTFNNTSTGTETYTGCTGDGYSVVVDGTTYNEGNPSGTEVLTNADGCDSVVTVTLTFNSTSIGTETYTGCTGDGYAVVVDGTTYNEGNPTGTETLSNANGCDSVVTVTLTFGNTSVGSETYTGCDGDGYFVVVGGTTYNEANPTGTETLTNADGCDSVVTVALTFNNTSTGNETYTGCVGDGYSVVVGTTTYNEANPSGTETLTNAAGCDSVVTVSLTFNNTSSGNETYTGCIGDGYSVVVGTTTYNEGNPSGTETLTNADGCDSVVTVTLTFNNTSTGTETYTGCTGDGYSVVVDGTTYNEGNPTGTETLTNANGCDSVVTVTLTFGNTSVGSETYTGCDGDGYSVVVGTTTYNEGNPSGTETLTNGVGCDSVVTVTLTFNSPSTGSETYIGCVGDGYSVVVGTTTYNETNPAGTETLTNAAGCDSVVTVSLTFNNTSSGNETYTGCIGDGYSVIVGSTTYNESNPTGTETLTNAAGCDSVVTVSLTFNNTSSGTETYTGCVGDGYTVVVGTTTYNEGNPTGTETLTNADGCDSVVTVTLVFNSPTAGSETYTGCIGDGYSVVVGSTTYDEGNPAGTETLTGINGCDSVVTISLTFNSNVTGTETYTGCAGDGYTVIVGGTTYDEGNPSGTETLTSGVGCDSVVTITLTFNSTSSGTETYTGCVGDGYSVVVGSTTYDESNPSGTETLTNVNGCDSLVTVSLTFNNTSSGNETYTGCIGDGYSVIVGGTTYDESNPTGSEILTNGDGCDSVVTITLVFNSPTTGNETYSGCTGDGYTVVVGGTTYDESNPTGTEIIPGANGCDSVVTINLVFANSVTGDELYSGCTGDGYSVIVNGNTYDESNPTGTETLTSGGGCDSVVTITLTFNSTSTGNETYTGCMGDGYSVVVNGVTYDESNPNGTETLTNAAGCDSVVTITLSFQSSSAGDETYSGCTGDGYSVIVNGNTYDESNPTGTETLTNSIGCDSVVTVALIFNNTSTGTESHNGCIGDGYSVVVNGTTYDEGNPTGTEILTNSNGCDSTVTINLMFANSVTEEELHSGCIGDGYSVVVNGTTYDESNPTGTEILTSSGGCDSIVTINLMFTNSVTGDETYSGCEGDGYSVVVNGTTYDESNPTGTETLVSGTGCDSIVTITLTFAPAPVASITPAGPFCADEGVQTLVGSPAGGVWSGDVSSDQFDPASLGEGQHEIIYTVSAGTCSDADTILVTVNAEVTISCAAVLGESAPGAMDGTGDVTVTDGTAPYDIAWSGPTSGSDVLNANGTYTMTGLSAGTYNITVTDANGCSDECLFNITSANCTVVIDDVDVIDAGCTGVNNGAIQINASGGTPPYMYSIDGVLYQSSNTFSGLAPGTLLVYVQDADGCISSLFVDILTGDGPTINLVSTSPSSCGAANGSIGVNATGGTPPYGFSNGGPFQPIGSFNGLASGSYQVIVRDDSGCRDTIVVDIIDDGAPVIDGIVATSANCGQASGSITIDASGGAGPLTYALNNGTPQTSNVFSGLPSGFYLIEVIDQNDCHVPSMVQIMDVGSPTVDNTIVTETLCGSNTGSIQIVASGGTGTLSYQIDNGGYSSNPLFQNLTSGNHTIDIRDASGCIVTIIVNVPAADGPQISTTPVIHTTCGEDNGQITVNASGGIGTLTYCIDPGGCQGSDDVFTDLREGTYEITVEDQNGCSAQSIVTINDSEGPTVDGIQEDEHCGNEEGFVIIFGTGGVEPYMYSFDGRPYSNNDFYGGLSSDFYDICVRDAQGCINCEEIFIDNDDPPDFINAIVTQSSCDQNDGSITILASSFFTLEYSINCTFYQTSNVFTGLGPGTYTVCIKDAFDCVTSVPVTIDPLPRPSIDNVNIVDAACTAPGSLTVISSGGNGAHQYSLNSMPFQTSNVFTGLGAGNYTIEIEDARGCTDQTSVTILGPVLDMTSLIETICEGDIYTVGSQDFNSTGIYEVTLPGSDGCDSVVTLNLTVQVCCTPITNTIDAVICEGELFPLNGTDYTIEGTYTDTIVAGAANGCDSILLLNLGVIPVVVTSEQGEICDGEVYDWNGQSFLVAGFYTDTLANPTTGCDSILTLDLVVNPLPVANAGADLILTCSVTSVTLDGSGTGSPQWTGPGVIDPDVWQTDVSTPGTYYLTATSSAGCIAIDSVVVDVDPEFPVADAGPDLFITCEDTVLTLQGSANSNGLFFSWTGPGIVSGQEHDEMPVVTEAGIYILTVENTANQCVSPPDTMLVTDITVDLLANINASGNLDCNSNSVLLTSGGSSSGPGIVYIWLNPLDVISLDVPSINATIPGTYFLFTIDSLSMCQAVDSHDVLDLTLYPQVDAGVDTILDCNVGFLELEANANGQQTGLLFSWTGPAGGIMGDPNLREIIIIAPGTYTVTATDTLNGCSNSDAVVVIDSRNLPTANAGPSQLIDCRDDTAILDGSGSSIGTQYLYTWNGPGIQNVHTISIEVALPGFYRLDVTNMETGCEASDSAEVQTSDFLSGAEISLIDPICLNDESGQIIVEQPDGGVPPFQYSMDGVVFQSSPVFANLDAGTYSLVIRDNVNCEWDTTVIINEGIQLTVDIGPDIEIDFGDMTDLFAMVVPPGIIDSIVWTPVEVLSCNDCLDPVLTVLYQNDFPVTATVFAGTCVATDDLLVIVDNDFDIFVPNVFSPNHDNINDHVTAFAGDAVERILEFDIFDRWGELIFHGSNFPPNVPELGWDGNFKGKPMNSGVFVYMLKVELIDGSELILSGDITLLR